MNSKTSKTSDETQEEVKEMEKYQTCDGTYEEVKYVSESVGWDEPVEESKDDVGVQDDEEMRKIE